MKKSLIALAFGTLALGMAEFVMMGILPDIARSLGVSIPEAGHLISAYALGVCFGAPLTVLVARTRPLKHILLALTGLIILGNACAAFSPNYWTLLAMRFVSGLPHGAFFGVGSIVAERVADKGRRAEAVSIMIAGMTVANLFGVPLGTTLSEVLSWRAVGGWSCCCSSGVGCRRSAVCPIPASRGNSVSFAKRRHGCCSERRCWVTEAYSAGTAISIRC